MNTVPSTIHRCDHDDFHSLLAGKILPTLKTHLENAGFRQRLRVTTLPHAVMNQLCEQLQSDIRWAARVLTASAPQRSWEATATKVIELRNALQVPLLVFVPPGLRTAAEDSLDIATFTELSLTTLSRDLVQSLNDRLDQALRPRITDALDFLHLERVIRNSDEEVEYLLTVVKNGATPAVAGAAMYVFGLVPDWSLFTQANLRPRLSKNIKACAELADIRRPLQERIGRLRLATDTLQLPLFSFLRRRHSDDTRAWTAEVATDFELHALTFDHWQFAQSDDGGDMRLVLDALSLPVQKADEVGGAAQMPVLDLDGKQGLKITFRSIPAPSEATAWKHFRFQIVTCDGDQPSVAWESNSYPKPAGRRQSATRTVKVTDLHVLDEGTYYLKIEAYDQSGAVITKPRRLDPGDQASRAENESELFLVIRGGTDLEPPQIRAVTVPSLLDAWVTVASRSVAGRGSDRAPTLAEISGKWLEPLAAPLRNEVHFRLEGPEVAGFTVVLPALLRKLEHEILLHPDHFGALRLNFTNTRSSTDVQIERRSTDAIPVGQLFQEFLAARTGLFELIRSQHIARLPADDDSPLRTSVVETADLATISGEIDAYATAYVHLAKSLATTQSGSFSAGLINLMAMLDVVELRWRKSIGDPGRALLISPTHPLRLLWHLQHTAFCQDAVNKCAEKQMHVPSWTAFFDQLRRGIVPVNLPMVLFDERGRGYVEYEPLTPHWSLYLPDRAPHSPSTDVTACREAARRHLGMRSTTVTTTPISAEDLARHLLEYLEQHPYVDQLRINAFGPGDAQRLADALRVLESARSRLGAVQTSPLLRYAVQMFSTTDQLSTMGEALESLLDPDRQVGEDDEFTLASSNHLLPKLVFARNTIDEFLLAPQQFEAHVSIFIDQFAVATRLRQINGLRRSSYVAGLVQEPETIVDTSAARAGWYKGIRPTVRKGATQREILLTDAVTAAQLVQAAAASGEPVSSSIAPFVALHLDAQTQALLKHAHAVSDWVITIDRNLGVDYFDNAAVSPDVGYLLDFAPEYLQEDRQRLLLTTRSSFELVGLVKPTLERFGLAVQPGDEHIVLETLRSLSGRLALRLLSSPTHAAEVVGLLFARWMLKQAGFLEERVIIPLDAHRSWFLPLKDDIGSDTSSRRADLLLVGFDPQTATLDFGIVEVKLREELSHGTRSALYREMNEQTSLTATRLRELFDPDLYPQQRGDFLLRAKELSAALSFYIRRARRYGLLTEDHAEAALDFAQDLDCGYHLRLRTLGVVFERQATGSHADEDEPGFTVYRFGSDIATSLLAQQRPVRPSLPAESLTSDTPSPHVQSRDSQKGDTLTRAVIDSLRSSLGDSTLAPRNNTKLIPPAGTSVKPVPAVSDPSISEPASPTSYQTPTNPEPPTPIPTSPTPPPSLDTTRSPVQNTPLPDILLGANQQTPQYGILGRFGDATVGIDLTGCNTISLFGVQGFGKSYTLGVIAEMVTTAVQGINRLPFPLATVLFHYHKSDAYPPEFASAVFPNNKQREIERLRDEYGAEPCGLSDVMLLAPEAKVPDRQREYPSIDVRPIKFNSGELGAESWKFLLGAYGNDALYVRQLVAIMRRHRQGLTLDQFEQEINAAQLPAGSLRLALDRIHLARPYIDDHSCLQDLLRPGRTVIVDLRDEWIEKDEALGLFVVMMRIFGASRHGTEAFNKLVVFDEAHKYIAESELIDQVVETIREMRHQGMSVVIASQDPLSVPRSVIELSSLLILHRMTSPQWLRHLKSAISALDSITDAHLATLHPGEVLVWAQRSTDGRFTHRPQKIVIRPRFSLHGGGTRTAVKGETIR